MQHFDANKKQLESPVKRSHKKKSFFVSQLRINHFQHQYTMSSNVLTSQ